MIGFSGVHLSGKTTLSHQVSEYYNIPFLVTNTANIATELGIKVSDPMGMHNRMILQEALYKDYIKTFETASTFVADRTFLDLVAYSFMDLSLYAPQYPNEWLPDFYGRCIEAQKKYFRYTFMLEPVGGDPVGNKGCMKPDYLMAFNAIYHGLTFSFPVTDIIPVMPLDLRLARVQKRVWL